ncbi:GNAT family N-acetyltransferase [Bacillus cabrialesii]|uniref:GNAT family N-acetyltransferase n=1 Tax=Bacillus cabrialesii subsp. tritici TaxID=2944916 RepID=A0ABT9DHU8_9BACI|nr:GNAT family N-acetyltransferase [Bacillus cabrialesii]OLQ57583.1 GNAT family N-acetyltransferase [Bacillus licheniformis]RJS58393.1 N-acetyltransferase [Bacillus subtilis]MBU2660784.1 GNAT family N-acetyltransferase [Bacillus cabrialesii]MDO8224274.1 GNAT family N-acetyltransferase [Bacillus cabrialesii subsp. tritici]MDU0156847.1 GNAT family N-acetyltransferase [Bacillus cabrialesii]
MIHMKQLTTKEEWAESYPVMSELRTGLDEETYLQRLEACVQKESYLLFALYEDTAIRALCGALPRISIHKGEHLWIADLVTSAPYRSKGYGKMLLDFAADWAKKAGCGSVSLSSGLQRKDAHRFYTDKMGFTIESYLFRKPLS